jgi:hypothetical protein
MAASPKTKLKIVFGAMTFGKESQYPLSRRNHLTNAQ